jgi:Fe-S-cluster containining protein
MDCSCDRCQSLCHNKPGWFTPQQIELVARKRDITIEDLFKDYLTIDAVLIAEAGKPTGVYVLAPTIVGAESGSISDPVARGTCVWLRNGKCDIHDVKPAECRVTDHSTSAHDSDVLRASILKQWIPYKKFVQNLYGKKLKLPGAVKEAYRKVRKNARTPVHQGTNNNSGAGKRA